MRIVRLETPIPSLSISGQVETPLMVCSHERSGTHFLMKSLSIATKYTFEPFLDFDYYSLGNSVNFFSSENVATFLLRRFDSGIEDQLFPINSIIKSHFPLQIVEKALAGGLKIAYIYRDPMNVFISYWKMLKRCDWFEAPPTNSPMELIAHAPAGFSQRYQMNSYSSYFERWAMHVLSALDLSKRYSNISIVSFTSLLASHKEILEEVCNKLSIPITQTITMPNKNDNYYIKGKDIDLPFEEIEILKEFCKYELTKYPELLSSLSFDF